MKYAALSLILSAGLTACVSTAEIDKDQAWAKCEKLVDRASRSSCMTKALSNADANRRAEAQAEEKSFTEGAKAIEDKAAVERAMGAPDDKTGTTIVREPFE